MTACLMLQPPCYAIKRLLMETLLVPNEPFLDQISELLAEGKLVTIRTKGNSMLPFIHGSRDCVELEGCDYADVDDIVLARVPYANNAEKYRYVLHRIIEINDGFTYADYSEHEYDPYFMRDTIHIGWKGWVYLDEDMQKFLK